jgi:hypothetical protein
MLSRPQNHSAAGRIMSMKNSNDTFGNRARDLPTCSAGPQPTVPQRATLYTPNIPNYRCSVVIPSENNFSWLVYFVTAVPTMMEVIWVEIGYERCTVCSRRWSKILAVADLKDGREVETVVKLRLITQDTDWWPVSQGISSLAPQWDKCLLWQELRRM